MTSRILIADDHEMVRRGIRSLLETSRRDIEVLEARDGREAVRSTIDWKPDLVILDVSMPLLDGFGAAREIRKISPRTSILILTFHKTDTLAEVARRIGVNGFLTKGEDSGVLLKAIDSAIASQDRAHTHLENSAPPPLNASLQTATKRTTQDISHPPRDISTRPLLRVLFIHSRIACIERCLHELNDVQFQVQSDVVLTSEQFAEHLSSKYYDIVLAEYPSPKWQAKSTLDLLHRTGRHIPLILVTGKMERQEVADLIAKGVADCVEIDQVADLPIAIRRALKENTWRGERKQVETKLRYSEAHYRALVGNLAYGICRCGMEGQFLDVNQAMTAILGYASREELLAVNLAGEILMDPARRAQLLGESGDKDRVDPLEVDWKRKDGTSLKVRLSGREVSTEEGKQDGYEIIVEDVTKQRQLEDQLRQQATRDPLTGLANYRYLTGMLESEIERSKRTGREFAILLFDLDGLKQINDRYGHIKGSEALCRLADVLATGCRSIDTAARFGGDEFALVLPETGALAARMVARRLCDNFADDGRRPKLSVSVGVAIYPAEGETIEALLSAADVALYAMKAKIPRPARMHAYPT
jgi:diguanylate cyclase (GGDEF)-like protein/PAS domain S-box-containing protein